MTEIMSLFSLSVSSVTQNVLAGHW